jgi:UDP-2,4-diacetamido-2,4,6-trideoxy-beta-L-altropyranose hydrolase
MALSPDCRVLFCVAAGPRVGFGHLARSRSLARALGVPLVAAVRGTTATRRAARDLGAQTLPPTTAAFDAFAPQLVIVDDPSGPDACAWVAHARRRGVPVASVHDLGRGVVPSDLVIDGSVSAVPACGRIDLAGPEFAILDPQVRERRQRPCVREADRVLIALGGGAHVRQFGSALAFGLCRAVPGLEIVVAAGFAGGRLPDLPAGGQWIQAKRGLAAELSRCAAAVVGGGVTLYEACALGTPVVVVAVAPGQRTTIRSFASRGAALDAGPALSPRAVSRVAAGVAALLEGGPDVEALTAHARDLIDGCGAFRVAACLTALTTRMEGRTYAA